MLRTLWSKTTDRSRIEFQKVFSCCDIDGYNITHHQSKNDKSCFVGGDTSGKRKGGCIKVLAAVWNENLILIAGLTGSVVLNEIIIVIISCILICDGREDNHFSKQSRVSPMNINEEANEEGEPGLVPLNAIERRNWAKHSKREDKTNQK